jgi:hypothetical protein
MALLLVHPTYEAFVSAGWGGRPGEGGAWGAVVGTGLDVLTSTLDMRLRLEARRQHGGFRQGAFGPDYELARFQAAGGEGNPLTHRTNGNNHVFSEERPSQLGNRRWTMTKRSCTTSSMAPSRTPSLRTPLQTNSKCCA